VIDIKDPHTRPSEPQRSAIRTTDSLVLVASLAGRALVARRALGAETNTVSNRVLGVLSSTHDGPDNLVSDNRGELSMLVPSAGDGVDVRLVGSAIYTIAKAIPRHHSLRRYHSTRS
jgi:hypothetical protein